MTVDADTMRKVARLARIAIEEDRIEPLAAELTGILDWVEQLGEVDVDGVEPMTSVTPMRLKRRDDAVTEGGDASRILANAPSSQEGFFVVPKIVE